MSGCTHSGKGKRHWITGHSVSRCWKRSVGLGLAVLLPPAVLLSSLCSRRPPCCLSCLASHCCLPRYLAPCLYATGKQGMLEVEAGAPRQLASISEVLHPRCSGLGVSIAGPMRLLSSVCMS